MTGPIPNVGVRFFAEDGGVAEAIRELVRQLRGLKTESDQTERSTRRTAKGFDAMADSLRDLGAVIGAARLLGFVKQVVTAGDDITKLAEKTGASVEVLSALAVSGVTAELSIQGLDSVLRRLALSLTTLQGGTPQMVEAFRAIGLSASDLNGLSVDESIRKVFDALSALPAGTEKATAAMRIFGRTGAEVIPLLNQLGEEGINGAIEKARELGLLLDSETSRQVDEFKDSVTSLKLAGAGVAAEFARGVIPTLTELATQTSSAIANLPPGLKAAIGNLIAMEAAVIGLVGALRILKALQVGALLTNPFTAAAVAIGAATAALITFANSANTAKRRYEEFLGTLSDATSLEAERARLTQDLLNNRAQAAVAGPSNLLVQLDLAAKRIAIQRQLNQLTERERQLTAPAGGGTPPGGEPDLDLLKARLQARQTGIRDELQLEEAKNRAQQQLNQSQYDAGIQSLSLYFRRRIGLTREAVAAEIAALEAQQDVLRDTPVTTAAEGVQRQSQIETIDNQITAKRVEGETRIRSEEAEQARAIRALAELRLGFETRIQEAKGATFDLAVAGIAREAAEYRKLLQQFGIAGADQDAAVVAFTSALTARAEFERVQAEIVGVFAAIERERTRIAAEVQVGVLTEFQGQRQIAEIESARLPVLRQMVDQARALALSLGNPELLAITADWSTQLVTLAASADLAAQETARFRANLEEAAISDLSTFLGQTITDVDSLAEAFLSLAESVVGSIRRITSEFLAAQIVRGLTGLLSSGISATTGSASASGSGFINPNYRAPGFATGGYTGPGSKYQPAGIVHAGEFVVNASRTAQYRGLLEAINAGGTLNVVRGYADGGFVSGMAEDLVASARVDGAIEVTAAPGTSARVTRGDLLRVVHENPRAIREALGIRA